LMAPSVLPPSRSSPKPAGEFGFGQSRHFDRAPPTPVFPDQQTSSEPVAMSQRCRFVAKVFLPHRSQIFCRRGDRTLMWGTTSLCGELTDDFGGASEATSIDACRLSFSGNLAARRFGTFATLSANCGHLGRGTIGRWIDLSQDCIPKPGPSLHSEGSDTPRQSGGEACTGIFSFRQMGRS
jgi:hypothetical protein